MIPPYRYRPGYLWAMEQAPHQPVLGTTDHWPQQSSFIPSWNVGVTPTHWSPPTQGFLPDYCSAGYPERPTPYHERSIPPPMSMWDWGIPRVASSAPQFQQQSPISRGADPSHLATSPPLRQTQLDSTSSPRVYKRPFSDLLNKEPEVPFGYSHVGYDAPGPTVRRRRGSDFEWREAGHAGSSRVLAGYEREAVVSPGPRLSPLWRSPHLELPNPVQPPTTLTTARTAPKKLSNSKVSKPAMVQVLRSKQHRTSKHPPSPSPNLDHEDDTPTLSRPKRVTRRPRHHEAEGFLDPYDILSHGSRRAFRSSRELSTSVKELEPLLPHSAQSPDPAALQLPPPKLPLKRKRAGHINVESRTAAPQSSSSTDLQKSPLADSYKAIKPKRKTAGFQRGDAHLGYSSESMHIGGTRLETARQAEMTFVKPSKSTARRKPGFMRGDAHLDNSSESMHIGGTRLETARQAEMIFDAPTTSTVRRKPTVYRRKPVTSFGSVDAQPSKESRVIESKSSSQVLKAVPMQKVSSNTGSSSSLTSLGDASVDGETWKRPADQVNKRKRKAPLSRNYNRRGFIGQEEEVQQGHCRLQRYQQWSRCYNCARRPSRDVCRFRGFRIFPLDSKTGLANGSPFFRNEAAGTGVAVSSGLNRSLTLQEVAQIEAAVLPVLLPALTDGLRNAIVCESIYRDRSDPDMRNLCDFCYSSLFGGFICADCGGEYCHTCRDLLPTTQGEQLHPSIATPEAAVRLACGAPGTGSPHCQADLRPVSHIEKDQLVQHWSTMVASAITTQRPLHDMLGSHVPLQEIDDVLRASNLRSAATRMTSKVLPNLYTTSTGGASPVDPAGLQAHSLPFIRIQNADDLTNDLFDELWAKGEPMVIDDCDKKLRLDWTPAGFVERHGSQSCSVVDCHTDQVHHKTVGEFFEAFGKPVPKRKMLKLKDWPPTSEFRLSFPDLYEDFNRALPVPDYIQRNGVRNLSAHYPDGPSQPDLGPKMYIAYAAREDAGSHGSTRLHMDVADAVNIMVYASEEGGEPGCAVWDIFRASDADAIRTFLLARFEKISYVVDPIHSQMYYLDAELRKELFEETGVVSWRIYQRPGQAVFIPAGCAHQVCNLADCIKIAMDFVSPHNIDRCLELTNDFRKENFREVWKDDLLQLTNVLWYAWLSSQEAKTSLQAAGADSSPGFGLSKLLNPFPPTPPPSPPEDLTKRLLRATLDHFESERAALVSTIDLPIGPTSSSPCAVASAPISDVIICEPSMASLSKAKRGCESLERLH